MYTETSDFAEQYRLALKGYLADRSESHLHHAYELGRQALDAGMGVLNLVSVHEAALAETLKEAPDGMKAASVRVSTAGRFLVETLSPFEMFHLGNRESNMALRRLNGILEEEVRRIAHALHDEAAQILATVYLEVAEISREVPPPVQTRVSRITDHLDEVREQLRQLSHELRPPILDQLGLMPALRFLGNGVCKRSGLDVTVAGEIDGRLAPPIETALYRVCQEALNNVSRHAQASAAAIRVWIDKNAIHCSIWDDGIGFEWPDPKGEAHDCLGLIGIQERVSALHGKFEVAPGTEGGTELRIVIPLNQDT